MDKLKLLFIFLIFIYNIWYINASLKVYNEPTFWDFSIYWPTIAIWYNPQLNYKVGVYKEFYENDQTLKDQTANVFCQVQWLIYKNSILSNNDDSKNSILFELGEWWTYNKNIYKFIQIVCEDNDTNNLWNGTGTGTNIIINNNNEGINKKIFTEEVLIEIYKYEALIMFSYIFYMFILRILRLKKRPKNKIL